MRVFHRIFLVLLFLTLGCGDDAEPAAANDADGGRIGSDERPDAGESTAPGLGDGEIAGSGASGGAPVAPMPAAPASDDAAGGAAGSGATRGTFAGDGDGDGDAPVEGDFAADSDAGVDDWQPSAGLLTAGAWDDNLNFDRFLGYRTEFHDSLPGALPIDAEEHESAHDRWSQPREANTTLDVALVIDTTGSMTDEIAYLQTEFDALSQAIEDAYPDSAQRWSLIVYRDETDDYVVRWFDFRDSAGEFREKLEMQGAAGGGDFPEAPDQALETMNQLQWRAGEDTARLVFWVADAPHHADNAGRLADALRASAGQDIHIYPVASSGVDELTELSMRSAAQLTGGRYLFLTDDSGVGGAHKEPTIPCYFVTQLDDAILRMVDIEMSGDHREPDASEVIRTGGNPQDGACTLESGEQLQSF
ncbi:MAG: VWA domain-containing protein [Myxococcales bacterium]|jgi:hypothetical protein